MARGRLSGDSDGYVKVLAQVHTNTVINTPHNACRTFVTLLLTNYYSFKITILLLLLCLLLTLRQIQINGRRTSHVIIGVHIIGEGANELIQLGSILVHSQSTLEMVSKTPFAAVTLSGIFQMACDDALLNSPRRKIKTGLAPGQIPSQI